MIEFIYVKPLEQYLEYSKHSMNISHYYYFSESSTPGFQSFDHHMNSKLLYTLCLSHEFRCIQVQEFWKQNSDLGAFKLLAPTPVAFFKASVCSKVTFLCPRPIHFQLALHWLPVMCLLGTGTNPLMRQAIMNQ